MLHDADGLYALRRQNDQGWPVTTLLRGEIVAEGASSSARRQGPLPQMRYFTRDGAARSSHPSLSIRRRDRSNPLGKRRILTDAIRSTSLAKRSGRAVMRVCRDGAMHGVAIDFKFDCWCGPQGHSAHRRCATFERLPLRLRRFLLFGSFFAPALPIPSRNPNAVMVLVTPTSPMSPSFPPQRRSAHSRNHSWMRSIPTRMH